MPDLTDDDLTELRRHVDAMADESPSFASAHTYQEARQALADAAPRLIAEVERLRAAAPASEDDRWVDLLSRADERANPDEERMYADEDADLIQELAAALRVGSPPPTPAPTAYLTPAGLRRLVEGAIFNALPLDIDRDAWAPKATDAVMALLPQPAPPTDELIRRAEAADAERDTALDTLAALSAPPLWAGRTMAATHRNSTNTADVTIPGASVVPPLARLPVPPGTAVEVREKRP